MSGRPGGHVDRHVDPTRNNIFWQNAFLGLKAQDFKFGMIRRHGNFFTASQSSPLYPGTCVFSVFSGPGEVFDLVCRVFDVYSAGNASVD
jgi:hypothetical protein